jgi:hypothetical protein
MALAPAPQLAACLEVLYRASIAARMMGYEGHADGLSPRQADQLAALMDAVHELPHLAGAWERCDEALLRGTLEAYDMQWGAGLLEVYDRKVAEHATS